MTLRYDRDADCMYITFERLPGQAYIYAENDNGDVLRLDRETRRIVGVTIPFFSGRLNRDGKVEIPEVGAIPFTDLAALLANPMQMDQLQ